MTQNNLRDEYCPARIHQSTALNKGHVRQPSFSDEQLGKPHIPYKPQLAQRPDWTEKPFEYSAYLAIFVLIPWTRFLALLALIGVWVWAYLNELPKYEKMNKETNENYKKNFKQYEIDVTQYNKVLLPRWENNRSEILKQKMEDWQKVAIDETCRQKSWRVHSKREIQATRTKGYIGTGEDHLVKVLSETHEIYTRHQVEIERYYTADIVCLNLGTGKLCVVEIDGSQHWLDSDQIQRDKQRMVSLGDRGVPTIRFINTFAASSPYECVEHIQQLLS